MDLIDVLMKLDNMTREESARNVENLSETDDGKYERGFRAGKMHMHAKVRQEIETLVPDFHDRVAERQALYRDTAV